ncbi:MAG: hypothetical protein ABH804_03090 [archaeon]
MGLIKKGMLVIVSVIFLVSMLILNSFFTVYSSLDYNTVSEELEEVVTEMAEKDAEIMGMINLQMPMMISHCENNSEYIFFNSLTGEEIEISCSSVNESADAVFEEIINKTIEQIYYEDYSCSGLGCVAEEKNPFVLLSENFRNYCFEKFYILLFVSVFLFALIVFLTDNKSNAFILGGVLIIISSLPMMKLEGVLNFFAGKFIIDVFSIFFSQSGAVFWKVLIIGIITLSAGVFMKLFGVGFKIANFFEKFKKDKKIIVQKQPSVTK